MLCGLQFRQLSLGQIDMFHQYMRSVHQHRKRPFLSFPTVKEWKMKGINSMLNNNGTRSWLVYLRRIFIRKKQHFVVTCKPKTLKPIYIERIESQIILEIEVSFDSRNGINVMPAYDKICSYYTCDAACAQCVQQRQYEQRQQWRGNNNIQTNLIWWYVTHINDKVAASVILNTMAT